MTGADPTLRTRLIHLVMALLGPGTHVPEEFPSAQELTSLGLSSLKMVHLMLAIEAEFDLSIPPADINPETFHSLDSIAALVCRLTAPSLTQGS